MLCKVKIKSFFICGFWKNKKYIKFPNYIEYNQFQNTYYISISFVVTFLLVFCQKYVLKNLDSYHCTLPLTRYLKIDFQFHFFIICTSFMSHWICPRNSSLPNKRGGPNNCLWLDILLEPSPFIRNEEIKFGKNTPLTVLEWKKISLRINIHGCLINIVYSEV